MKKHNFTREETIQALKVCSEGGVVNNCRDCPYKFITDGTCVTVLLHNALMLIEKEEEEDG